MDGAPCRNGPAARLLDGERTGADGSHVVERLPIERRRLHDDPFALDDLFLQRDLQHGLLPGSHQHVRHESRFVADEPHLKRLPPERHAGQDEAPLGIGGCAEERVRVHDDHVSPDERGTRVAVKHDAAHGLAVLGYGCQGDEQAEQSERTGHGGQAG